VRLPGESETLKTETGRIKFSNLLKKQADLMITIGLMI
jgi:hypothetical protein